MNLVVENGVVFQTESGTMFPNRNYQVIRMAKYFVGYEVVMPFFTTG